MDEELAEIAARMRAYALANPFNPLQHLANPKETEKYTYDTIQEGFSLRFIFSFLHLSRLDVLQLSISHQPVPRAIPPELADKIRDAFFEPEEIVNMIRKDVRNDIASLIGRPRIAEGTTEHFFCAKPRKGA